MRENSIAEKLKSIAHNAPVIYYEGYGAGYTDGFENGKAESFVPTYTGEVEVR